MYVMEYLPNHFHTMGYDETRVRSTCVQILRHCLTQASFRFRMTSLKMADRQGQKRQRNIVLSTPFC